MTSRRKAQQEQRQSPRCTPRPTPHDGRQESAAPSSGPLCERDAELVSPVFERVGHETIPKVSEVQMHQEASRSGSSGSAGERERAQQYQRVVINNQGQRTDQRGQRRMSLDPPQQSSDFRARRGSVSNNELLNSLAASNSSFFRSITIEPVAFLAIMALYLEFPAIQDLIYTRICIEVVAAHSNISRVEQIAQDSFSSAGASQNNSSAVSNATLPTHARIQQLIDAANQSSQASPTSPTNSSQTLAPILTDYHVICNRLKTAVPLEIRQEIRETNSLFWLKYQILVCLLCALSGPYWGGVSDKIGRVLPLNVPIFASILCNSISLAFGLLISLDSDALIHINWLYAGAVLVGLSGGQSVLIMNSFSYISDNTTSEERSKRVTVLESVIFVAHSVGFFLSKLIMTLGLAGPEEIWLNRHFVSFSACILINLLCILYSSWRLRHHKFHKFLNNFEREQAEAANLGVDNLASSGSSISLGGKQDGDTSAMGPGSGPAGSCDRLRELTLSTPDDPDGPIARSDKSNWSVCDTLITFSYYKQTYETATKPREARSAILLLLLLGFISALSLATLMSLLFIYVKMDPFNWPTSEYSAWNANSSITRGLALITLTLLMKFVPAWQVPDALVAALGFAAKGAGLLMIGLAESTALINWSLIAFTFSEFSMPPIRSLLSKLVVKEELGKLYSCLGTLQSLCFILGNIAFYLAFTSFVQADLFKLTFITVGAIEIGALVVVSLVYTTIKRQILIT